MSLRKHTKQFPDVGRANVLGVGVHAVNLDVAVGLIEDAVKANAQGYVCVTGVHGVMEARRNSKFKAALKRAFLVVPDGVPTVWIGRWQGKKRMARVFGPDLMRKLCQRSVETGITHYLYGGKPGVAEELKCNLERWFPGIRIVGTCTPPFRPLSPAEKLELQEELRQKSPDLFWIGLSTPKQEQFMAENLGSLNCKVMLGVGAAFDIHTARIKDAPAWVKSAGLQWLHRLCQEPSRLWKRYLFNNSEFIYHTMLQFTGLKRYELEPRDIAGD